MENIELIQLAEKALKRHVDRSGRLHGDVAAAVLSRNGKVYLGVCVDTPGWGLCAERSAIAAMITDGEYEFEKVVAVWRDNKSNKLVVLPPCGHCRQFMQNVSEGNLEAEVILSKNKNLLLRDLIPFHEWPEYLD